MARQRRRNQGSEVPYGEWIPAHAVRFNSDGTVSLMAEGPTKNRGRRRNASDVVNTIHRQLLAQGMNPRLDYVAWDENTLKVSKGMNGALIHYNRGTDLYDITEYHGGERKSLGTGYYADELFNAVLPTLSPRKGF